MEPGPAPSDETALARRNRRRGLAVAALPGVVAGVVVAVVLLVLVDLVVGLVAGVVVGVAVGVGTWWAATPVLLRALRAEPADDDDYARVFNQVEGLCATNWVSPCRLSVWWRTTRAGGLGLPRAGGATPPSWWSRRDWPILSTRFSSRASSLTNWCM